MKVAIDLDGTAFDWPGEFQLLVTHLMMGHAEVVFLTAAAGELPPHARPAEVAKRIAKILPFCVHVPVVCCESRDKGSWLLANGFNVIIDDSHVEGWPGLQLFPKK